MLTIKKNKSMIIIGKSGKLARLYDWFCIFLYIILEALNVKFIGSFFISFMLLCLFFIVICFNIGYKQKIIKSKQELLKEIKEFLKDNKE